ncbi:hypothetical protein CHLRE_03g205950v5 [Chlamydomonas reinhardtii]|uniref:Protein kinase domain-containing protein n=1 Tax=Chlamydomonas reinhardtii TaxID=3055 RepID=A0A2K3DZ05_CHLRE|nr:uncharacterized protein CHLRE_03g205950v5 [Chlamydomonas reinhardtii]PNW85774.1 hypothetical protein CHLRE_03g205950v5 [Chlamydomonas reinhardtii]
MSFLNRLFNRKKPELGAQQQPLRRSLTEPSPSSVTPSRGRRSSSDDRDTFDITPPSRVAPRGRRVGVELARAKTSVDVTSVRSSAASSAPESGANNVVVDGPKTQYKTLRTLHRSRLHTISLAQDRNTKAPVVLKTFFKARLSSSARAKLDAEVTHLRSLCGVPGVVKYVAHFEDDDSFHIVLERCPGTTLIELVANSGGRLAEAALVCDVLIPLTVLLADLHRRGVVHRHIKPEHVLCAPDTGAVTLLDFSEAADRRARCLNNRAGTLEYMAPEVLDKPSAEEVFHQVLYNGMSEEELPQYDEKADVWSLGVLVYEALTGCQPFLADSAADMMGVQRQQLHELDGSGTPKLFAGRHLSGEARSFLEQALQLDPINRPSAERLLQHPLLQRHWQRYHTKQVALLGASAATSDASQPTSSGNSPAPGSTYNSGSGGLPAASRHQGVSSAPLPLPRSEADIVQSAVAAGWMASSTDVGMGGGGGGGSNRRSAGGNVASAVPERVLAAPIQFAVR